MAGKTDWKQKYYELRSKYLNAIDVAFRLGVEEGQKNQKLMDMETQLQQAQEAQQAAAMGGGMPGEDPMMGDGSGEELPPEEAMAQEGDGDELDSSIDELEQYVKNERPDYASLLKSFHAHKTSKQEGDKKDKRVKKIDSILKKWDEDNSAEESTENGDILGQS